MKKLEFKTNDITISQLDKQKEELHLKVIKLVELKDKLYSDMDIESPMSKEEKDLKSQISSIYSQINTIIRKKRKLKRTGFA